MKLTSLIFLIFRSLLGFFGFGQGNCMYYPSCSSLIVEEIKQKGFIKAEIYSVYDIKKYRSEINLKEAGKIRQEGKDYIVKDGDIIYFKFNV